MGNAAANGLMSALLAAEGFQGPLRPIEGPRGFLQVMGEEADFDSVTQGLGVRWEILNNTYKPYPCGIVLSPVIEACLELHGNADLALEDIEKIELTGHSLLRERTDRPEAGSGREAQVSAQHAVAVALTRGKAGLDEFSDACAADPAWKDLAGKVTFVDDDNHGIESARVALHLRSGSIVAHHVETARGSLAMPLSDQDLERKLTELAAWGGSGCVPGPLIEALWALDQRPDAGSLMALAEGRN